MQSLVLAALLAIVVCVSGQATEVTATFSSADAGGVTGWVKIDNAGNISAYFDSDAADAALTALESGCTMSSALKFHIHDLWTVVSPASAFAPLCSGTETGLHYDPGHACGPFSASTFCDYKGKCVEPSSSGSTPSDYAASCNPTEYQTNPYGCEVGDIGGKWGAVTPKTYWSVQDPFMPTVDLLVGKSVVFHCPAGARAFCAVFAESSTSAPAQSKTDARDMSITKLTAESPYGTIEFLADGSHTISLDVSSIQTELETLNSACITGGMKYHVHEMWADTTMSYGVGSACGATATGGHIDPYIACGSATGNTNCYVLGGCVNGSTSLGGTTYTCDTTQSDPYACEAGDLSSIFGNVAFTGTTSTAIDTATKPNFMRFQGLMPELSYLDGKSIVFHCATGGARAMCMKIGMPGTGTSGTTGGTTGDASTTADAGTTGVSAASSFAPALLLSVAAFFAAAF